MISPNTIIPIAHVHVKDRHYSVYISMCTVTRHMHVFKYNDVKCDYEIFATEGEANKWLEKLL